MTMVMFCGGHWSSNSDTPLQPTAGPHCMGGPGLVNVNLNYRHSIEASGQRLNDYNEHFLFLKGIQCFL